MTPSQAEGLLERLSRGEPGVTEELYSAYAAYLRAVVRRQLSAHLRTQFDSADVVQSVWVQVVRCLTSAGWHVETEEQLRALLGVIARRRVFTRARSPAVELARLQTAEVLDTLPVAGQPHPSELAQADELWETLLELCPAEHRNVLHFRRAGLPLREIASRTGLHEGSVRRILRTLSRELALRTRESATVDFEAEALL